MTSPKQPMIEWLRYPETEAFISELVDQFVIEVPVARDLQADLLLYTGSRLLDWLDHLVLADGDWIRGQLAEFGFEPEEVPAEPGDTVYYHPGALFPRLLLRAEAGAEPGAVVGAAIQVEQINKFLMTHHFTASIEGTLLGPYRRARLSPALGSGGHEFSVVERRGHRGFVPLEMPPDYPGRYLRAFERWETRPRRFEDPREGMAQTLKLAQSLVSDLGTDVAAWVAFAAERAYWQRRNKAGQIQKARQEQLGMGWANHDHHTFRSSRRVFNQLIEILETLGFRPRERFYAGAEAGWGAQVMEQPACRFAVFADVDLAPDEVEGDFAHEPLAAREGPAVDELGAKSPPKLGTKSPSELGTKSPPRLGTVGLWCALHGESMLGAGLHHLAGRFDFETVAEGLSEWGIQMMHPFSDFPHLRQAFTRGERWEIPEERLERLLATGRIDAAQRERFAEQGAVGSHLENIQRGEGFKGFNQQTVSDIIRRTDPRTAYAAA